jgi:hypothetical protein
MKLSFPAHLTSLLSPTRARLIALAVLAAPFWGFAAYLDRYPSFYIDETFFNYPPVAKLKGGDFIYQLSLDAPHWESVWAYNGPFFPRLQWLTFTLFGSTQLTWRLPEFICGFVSVGLLCNYLAKAGFPWSCVLLAVGWLGDRSLVELLLGRPDGIAMMFLVISFLLLMEACASRSRGAAFATGVSVGVACGFHLTAASFLPPIILMLVLSVERERLFGMLASFVGGGLLPLGAIIWIWSPQIPEALEQVMWHVGMKMPGGYLERAERLFFILNWSRYWAAALILAWMFCGAIAVRTMTTCLGPESRRIQLLLRAAFFFGLGGVTTLCTPRALYPYYLIYFSLWPMLGLFVYVEMSLTSKPMNLKALVPFLLLAAAWVPSLGWNAMRFREAFCHSEPLHHRQMLATIHTYIPANAETATASILVVAAVEADLSVKPLPLSGEKTRPSETAFLLLPAAEVDSPTLVYPEAFHGRDLVFLGSLFPGSGLLDVRVAIFSPVRRQPSRE